MGTGCGSGRRSLGDPPGLCIMPLLKTLVPAAAFSLLAASFHVHAQVQAGTEEIMPTSSSEVLTAQNLGRVKRQLLEGGARCTYVNRYNHNPCAETAGFQLYLNPDPGPDGHPQWNINSDMALGDFNTLMVRSKRGDTTLHELDFRNAAALLFGHDEAASRPVLEAAVLELLRSIDSAGKK